MTDDLTAQVAKALFYKLDDARAIQDTPHPRVCARLLAADLAPQIAACMQAVEDAAWVRGQRGDVTAFGEERTWAAGLAALRGEP